MFSNWIINCRLRLSGEQALPYGSVRRVSHCRGGSYPPARDVRRCLYNWNTFLPYGSHMMRKMPQAFSSDQEAGQNGVGVRGEGEMRPLPPSSFPFPAKRFLGWCRFFKEVYGLWIVFLLPPTFNGRAGSPLQVRKEWISTILYWACCEMQFAELVLNFRSRLTGEQARPFLRGYKYLIASRSVKGLFLIYFILVYYKCN